MSNYLDRLKQLEGKKNLSEEPNTQPSKPPKATFDPFGGTTNVHIQKNNTEKLCDANRDKELRYLVRLVSDYQNFIQQDYEEALEIALGDPVTALICFTSLARQANLIEFDEKVSCGM